MAEKAPKSLAKNRKAVDNMVEFWGCSADVTFVRPELFRDYTVHLTQLLGQIAGVLGLKMRLPSDAALHELVSPHALLGSILTDEKRNDALSQIVGEPVKLTVPPDRRIPQAGGQLGEKLAPKLAAKFANLVSDRTTDEAVGAEIIKLANGWYGIPMDHYHPHNSPVPWKAFKNDWARKPPELGGCNLEEIVGLATRWASDRAVKRK